MGAGGIPDIDGVAGGNVPTCNHDTHDPGPADLFAGAAVLLAVDEHHLEHAIADISDLLARVAQAGERKGRRST